MLLRNSIILPIKQAISPINLLLLLYTSTFYRNIVKGLVLTCNYMPSHFFQCRDPNFFTQMQPARNNFCCKLTSF